ncbi:MAG: homoserine dehydrogenase [Gammaproteobacteria bacterium]|nr:homoserine dehydrogenase [Gammaproteobacteria bacterium]
MKIAICGAGTVGQGVTQILHDNHALITARTGGTIEVTVVASRSVPTDQVFKGVAYTADIHSVCRRDDVDVVVELIGGTTDAKVLIEAALGAGKSVVTANKALIAEYGDALFALAAKHEVQLRYEAAVAGSIPIIKVIQESLAGNQIGWLAGIINGTANFILTEMAATGPTRTFDEVLQEAQTLGYAEADPTFDVEGIDAAHKLTILSAIAFDQPLRLDRVEIEGISSLDPVDFKFARELGFKIKHLGVARCQAGQLEMSVHPSFVPMTAILAQIDGVQNAVLVCGDAAGEILCAGAGAGAGPTGSAVVSDLIDLVEGAAPGGGLGARAAALKPLPVRPPAEVASSYYLRISVEDQPGVMSAVTSILARRTISLDKILQEDIAPNRSFIVLVTDPIQHGVIAEAINELQEMSSVIAPVQSIRVFR